MTLGSIARGLPDLIPGGTPIGVNGIVFWRSTLVANTTTRHVLRVSIQQDGTAGAPELFHQFSGANDFLDGIAVDVHGNLCLPVIGQSTLARSSRAGETTVLATAEDGLDFPASLAFGTSHGTRHSLFVTNFAVFRSPDPERPGPSVVEVLIGTSAGDNCRVFDATDHMVCGHFRAFWEAHAGLMLFGYPITDAFEDEQAGPCNGSSGHDSSIIQRTPAPTMRCCLAGSEPRSSSVTASP